ncbi:cell adhesion molecule Dscam2-like [Panulirus ornatus]|uniref:cell adhesion molecule Dscam2-like n=1 Tax=Panulirus ornatus TaxID=150431 RepID=UPI003A89B5F1
MGHTWTYLLPRWLLLLIFALTARRGECRAGVQEGPQFLVEPPPALSFLNTTGAALHCSAHGNPTPTVSWVVGETGLQQATTVVGVREILANGSLVFLPFSPRSYRQDVHAASYRCLASSPVGRIVSRTVTVRAGITLDDVTLNTNMIYNVWMDMKRQNWLSQI